jgi:hypothetical protein
MFFFLFHFLTKCEALSAHFYRKKLETLCVAGKHEKAFLFDQTFYFVSKNMPKKWPNGLFVSLDQIGSPVLSIFIEKI